MNYSGTPTFRQALRYWIYLGFINFGGPAGQIGIMHKDLVERRRWISEDRFMHALNYCMLLPGPEAQQLAIYIGWLLHKIPGGIAAGMFFIIPGFLTILILSILYVSFGNVAWVTGMFAGLRPAVTAIIASALLGIGRRALKNRALAVIAAAAFIGLFVFNIPFPLIIVGAMLAGYIGGRYAPGSFSSPDHSGNTGSEQSTVVRKSQTGRTMLLSSLKTIGLWGSLWLIPVLLLFIVFGWDNIFTQLATFFSIAAVVTFGGAYAVLAFMAQAAVEWYGWMQPGQMLDGLALAESTPGPLIQVTQFVAFLAAFNADDGFNPVTAGIIASILVTWVTFLPSFLWIFAGAPYIEKLRGNKNLGAAMSAITAAVVGVILNLALWFGLNTLFGEVRDIDMGFTVIRIPVHDTVRLFPLVVASVSFILIQFFKWKVILILLISILLGIGYQYIFS
jgi:chromate transporter